MRQFTFLFFIGIIIISISSCRTDFEAIPSSGKLKFSKDTIYLDTVFSTISSSTYTLKIYNQSKNDINIPSIKLGKGLNSKYRMTVDGMQGNHGKSFDNVNLLAKDSIYIFIETTAESTDANPTDFLYTDQILFDGGANLQKVELVTLIQDAVFLYPKKQTDGTTETLPVGDKKIYGFFLDENDPVNGNELHFTNQKPYVIYGYAAVPSGKTVTFDPGSRVHFHAESGLLLSSNATLKINGIASTTEKLENEVIFEGDRLEPDFSNVPGQWGAIWLTDGSTNHKIDHLTIKNATIGLLIDNNNGSTVQIKNTQIYDCTNYGILAQTAKINGENLVINNAGLAGLACTYGGSYKFTHCTFNNNWSSSSQVAVIVNNYYIGATPEVKDLSLATFNNCIIYGSYSNEMLLSKKTGSLFEYQFNNCLLKFSDFSSNSLYQFDTDPTHYNAIIRNKDPKFLKVEFNKLNIDDTSAAFAKGNATYLLPMDILGNVRTLPPDLGAYQNKAFPK
ncbi:right-handed parallel beta-helix repeat-containing protein [Flavobacterium cellulosilyticum]|uniref:Right-handed parallel beta-helix repeat-containing protein n=1 Tax=Flavobacterium cellulosilyticum TaxID=2541731 RepID=A0A4R5CEZ3_9FLAO|nr:right-handed parallel beta-helix repeat-containing protein [Flavobacterium cellulosilyticum]TDD95782.1 right-handed parallel beta-helix repeat-containing protein [Flavobacterium cellulosilyticum]